MVSAISYVSARKTCVPARFANIRPALYWCSAVIVVEELVRAVIDPDHGGCTFRHYSMITGSHMADWTPHCSEMLEEHPTMVRACGSMVSVIYNSPLSGS